MRKLSAAEYYFQNIRLVLFTKADANIDRNSDVIREVCMLLAGKKRWDESSSPNQKLCDFYKNRKRLSKKTKNVFINMYRHCYFCLNDFIYY